MKKSLLPLGIFIILAIGLGVGLTLDPTKVPSALIDKAAPEFDLAAAIRALPGLKTDDLKEGEVTMINFFGSWCPPCEVEHPVLMELAERGVEIYAIDYKDTGPEAAAFLDRLGNPYTRIGEDLSGRTGIDFGITGVPETFIFNGEGRMVYQYVGPMSPDDIDDIILPVRAAARAE